jgi:hypothetical protein
VSEAVKELQIAGDVLMRRPSGQVPVSNVVATLNDICEATSDIMRFFLSALVFHINVPSTHLTSSTEHREQLIDTFAVTVRHMSRHDCNAQGSARWFGIVLPKVLYLFKLLHKREPLGLIPCSGNVNETW